MVSFKGLSGRQTARKVLLRCGGIVPASFRAVNKRLGLLLLCLFPCGAVAQTARVVVVSVPGLRADDLIRPELPTLNRLIAEGASGWMVCRAARGEEAAAKRNPHLTLRAAQALTLGSGARALARYTALNSIGSYADQPAFFPTMLGDLKAINAHLGYPVSIGALGDALHHAGRKTAVIGNADTDTSDRSMYALAMDSQGSVDSPRESLNRVQPDGSAPYGFRADLATMLHDYDQQDATTALVVLDFGDLERADRYAPLCLPAAATIHRTAALHALDSFLASLLPRLHTTPQTALVLLAPGPALSAEPLDRLAPVVLWGAGSAPGLLTSASTRHPGLVLNTDFLPTVLARLQLPPLPGATGRPMQSLPDKTTPIPSLPQRGRGGQGIRDIYTALLTTARQQHTPGGLPTVQLLLVLIGAMGLFFRRPQIVRATLAAIVTLPLGMLLLPPVAPGSVLGASALLALFSLACALPAWRRENDAERMIFTLIGLLPPIVLLDLLTGSHLLQRAWMSYSVMEGARFYGIGNEYMGAVIGAMCVLPGRFATFSNDGEAGKWRLWGMGALALLVTMGASRFGAKVGAIPSAGTAFGAIALLRGRGQIRAREMLGTMVVLALLLAGFAALDLRHAAGEQSHLARAFSGAGGGSVLDIAQRKLALEGALLLRSPWSLTLLAAGFGLGRLRRIHAACFQDLNARATFAGLVVGGIASLLCNDSGLTAAALIALYGWVWAVGRVMRAPS